MQEKLTSVVSDNAANITAAIKLTEWILTFAFRCFAHTLNLIAQDSLKLVKPIIQKVKVIVEYFHRSTHAAEKLKSLQEQFSKSSLK